MPWASRPSTIPLNTSPAPAVARVGGALALTIARPLGKAEDWKLIAKAPKIKWLKVPESDFDFLDFGESENFLAAGEAEWLAMIAAGMKAGLRQGEMLALRWRDVDFTAGKINVRQNAVRGKKGTPKGHESRSIPMSPVLASILRDHRHQRGELWSSAIKREEC